jgi:hypothetical protein
VGQANQWPASNDPSVKFSASQIIGPTYQNMCTGDHGFIGEKTNDRLNSNNQHHDDEDDLLPDPTKVTHHSWS